ncbi:putative DNA repair protein 3 [Elsinoe australis]|uniref:Putative DNA repair protein 3 n=1 Tax=Elsinoe australis TaxID=40998 RepID=A0A4U7B1I5_9PEZI|nr:putative DNA repair protein 3 [Elsinoe australis]
MAPSKRPRHPSSPPADLTPSKPGHIDLSFSPAASPSSSPPPPSPHRLAWSDDDSPSAAFTSFKKRKTASRATAAATSRRAAAAATASRSAVVGRKPSTLLAPTKKQRKRSYGQSESEDDDDDAIEKAQPQFLKERRGEFERDREKHGTEGLRVPPVFEFDREDDGGEREVRPVLEGLRPVAEDKGRELRYSAGVVPGSIARWLREYQVQGAEFLHELFVFQRGGVLGDDMGLGKTIQVIAFLTAAFGKVGDERDKKRMRRARRLGDVWYPRVLVVCPGGLMRNWEAELRRWGWWEVGVYHGSGRAAVLDSAKKGMLEIVITTYTTYRNDQELINLVDWDACIADECHIIKERKAEITKAMDKINALCRIGLTGTAIQNRYEEMWTILNWTNPGRFGPLSVWKASIAEPLKTGQSHDATVAQLAMARKTAKKLVQNLLPQFFLRRMKTLIADQLPKKTDKVVFCPLTDAQSTAYENLVEGEIIQTIRGSSEMCDCNSGKKRGWCCHDLLSDGTKWQNMVFPALATLQKLSNHLAMLIPPGNDSKEKQERDVGWLQTAVPDDWRRLWGSRDNILNFANQEYCGKWKVLKKLLRFWHQDSAAKNKVLVFSHSVRLLKMLHMLFQSTTTYSISYLDGAMSYEERSDAVDEFNARAEQFVFLISTKAGGVGLNITSANRVVVFDPNWNPSYDLQAQDRAYRIGQTRDVEVYRLISAGTVEEIVYARQIYKQQQANIAYSASEERRYFKGVQGTTDKRGEIFGLANMFTFQGDNVVLRDIVNKTNVAESKAGVSVVDLGTSQEADEEDKDKEEAVDDDDWFKRVGDKEHAAMSQVAALITGEAESKASKKDATTKKTDAVAAILAGAGVEYTHENSEVIGTSKIEAKLSRRAEAASGLGNEHVFVSQNGSSQVATAREDGVSEDELDARTIKYRFKPPEHVRKRQFVTMARMAGYEDATEFALVVEGWTQEKRRNFLDKFYCERRRLLADGV